MSTVNQKKSMTPDIGLLDAIYSRRSVRYFTEEPVPDSMIETLLDAAIQAPSALNTQPWSFLIIQNKGLLRCISNEAKESLNQDREWHSTLERANVRVDNPKFDIFYGASTVIVICARRDGFEPIGDCYLAAQNLMLAAMAFDLATCPIGLARDILNSEAYKKELAIPASCTPILPIAIGYTNRIQAKTSRRPPPILGWKK